MKSKHKSPAEMAPTPQGPLTWWSPTQWSHICQGLAEVTRLPQDMGTTVSCWHHSPLDVTLEAKYPGSWKKMSMAQILHTNWSSTFSAFNYSHPSCFSVCKCLVLQPGEPHMPTIPWDPSNLSSLLLGGFGAAQKHLLFTLANPGPHVLYIYTFILPFQSLCY